MTPEYRPDVRRAMWSAAYFEGSEAREAGQSKTANPYARHVANAHWIDGWEDRDRRLKERSHAPD